MAMDTNPFAPDTIDLLSGTLTHLVEAQVVLPSGETVPLDLTDGTLSWDERRTPRVEADLTCVLPKDKAQLDRIDPRTGARLELRVGYLRPDGLTDLQLVADLGLRTRGTSQPADTMRLFAQSDEAIVLDNAPSSGGTINQATTTAAIVWVLQQAIPGLAPTISAGAGAAINQTPVGDKVEAVNDLADRIDAKVYDNGLRTWFIAPTPTSTATPTHFVAVGRAGTVLDHDRGLGRDEFFNRVLLRYRWGTGAGQTEVASLKSITTGAYAATGTNIRTLEVVRELPATQPQADAAAQAMVQRTVTRGRSLALSAVAAYWLRPGHALMMQLGDGVETHLVSSIAFSLKQGRMDITTRVDDEAANGPTLDLTTTDNLDGTIQLDGSAVSVATGVVTVASVLVAINGNTGTFTTLN